MKTFYMLFAFMLCLGSTGFAKEKPCHQIVEACKNAGFIKGEAKEGKGLWKDCVNPIMQGTPSQKAKLPLPAMEASVIAACKQARPHFGLGKAAK